MTEDHTEMSALLDEVGHWECSSCGGSQSYSRSDCHNCHEGKCPRMDRATARKVDEIWRIWSTITSQRRAALGKDGPP